LISVDDVLVVLAIVSLVPGVVAVVTERTGRCGSHVTAALQLLLPWWGLIAAVVVVVAAVARSWWLVIAAAVVVLGVAVVVVPKLARRRGGPPQTGSTRQFSVGLANLYLDNPEPEAATRQLLDAASEILVLTELTPHLLDAFDATGGRDRFPHRLHREPLHGEYEAGIFSVHPFTVAEVHTEGELRVVDATVALPEGDMRVVVVHPEAPTDRAGFRRWRAQLRTLRELLAEAEPETIVLGDFNAGTLQPPYEALLTTSFRDAHDLLGSSLTPSWGVAPGLPHWVPTFVARLDHLLVGPAVTVVELRDLDPIGSDHRPFLATLARR
jgi:endonuclease/exonuclease/phosphatase (EEP) superfamily protein YafD